MATSRETLKYYFRKYALPTEQQYAELIDSFVHKDEDLLTQEKIDGLTTALADKLSAETFESFKTEIQAQIAGQGTVSGSLEIRLTAAETSVSTLRDDVDANTDNISGLNQRVETLENASPEQTPVTGSYLKQIADLDSYEGSEGEIVQYIGATNENFTRGFCYERKEGESDVYYSGGSFSGQYGNNSYTVTDNRCKYRYKEQMTESIMYKSDSGGAQPMPVYPYVFWDEERDTYLYATKAQLDDSDVCIIHNLTDTRSSSGIVTMFRHSLTKHESGGQLSWQVIPVSPCVH